MRKAFSLVFTVLAGLLLAGCPGDSAEPLEYRVGVARIGEDYHLFAPVCPGDKLSAVEVGGSEHDMSRSGVAYSWWSASRPADPAASPFEFVVLGDDGPFQHVAMRAGGNPLRPTLPADFRVSAGYTDGYGARYQKTISLELPAVPAYPAGTDPRRVRYLTRPLDDMGDLAGPEEIRSHSACATAAETPLRQTADSMRSEAPGRVDRAMLDRETVGWLMPFTIEAATSEDVAAHLCGNGPGFGALVAAFGQERIWREPDFDVDTGVEVRYFTGAYGRITAGEAIGQVDGRFGCARYDDGGVAYAGPHRVGLSALDGVDRQLLYCEESEHSAGRCTLLLARGDILSRLVVQAATAEQAETSARALADDAAAALNR
ncbi:hypothetical protein Q0Z83_012740 [Actinoplanes sichuanensis]|uniref:Lipoprotein n=1 Tax=Actinoplanes sichuanensis TaxID=512349 RepID=A0ABW4A5Z2_9ACTN|nr:hypothetical protein [Actinoplanes sichuanensis]BEL03083.1 hypothetical protein Q0Z83_012740 [Actinoplanes sichuanensis]